MATEQKEIELYRNKMKTRVNLVIPDEMLKEIMEVDRIESIYNQSATIRKLIRFGIESLKRKRRRKSGEADE